jgi:hypothetical protein
VLADELTLQYPEPEFMFMAASEAEWKQARSMYPIGLSGTYTFAVTLSSLFSSTDQPIPLPQTLMGRFVVLHGKHLLGMHLSGSFANPLTGILQHAWRLKRALIHNELVSVDPFLASFQQAKSHAVHQSLRRWHEGWPESLIDFEPIPECSSLYQDRAQTCWYLAGIIILPYANLSSPKTGPHTDQHLTAQQMLERIVLLTDQNKLQGSELDFETIYRVVAKDDLAQNGADALGTLMYRESDSTRAEFPD